MWQWDAGVSVSLAPKLTKQHYSDSVIMTRLGRKVKRVIMNDHTMLICGYSFINRLIENDSDVVGGDFINSFYWYFDFQTNQCTLGLLFNDIKINNIEMILFSRINEYSDSNIVGYITPLVKEYPLKANCAVIDEITFDNQNITSNMILRNSR